MRSFAVMLLIGVLLGAAACAQQRKVPLTDAELGKIGAGWNLCGFFDIRGPCVGSRLEIFDPALGPTQSLQSSTAASPLPQSGTVTLNQSVTIQGPSTFQSASQTNSVTITPPSTFLCPSCSRALDRIWIPGR